MKIKRIPLLRLPEKEFKISTSGKTIKYTADFIEDQIEKIDKDVYLYTDYINTFDSSELYIMRIFTDQIVKAVCNDIRCFKGPVLRMKKYDKDTNTMLCVIDDKTSYGAKFLEVLENDKVYISFILSHDTKDDSTTIQRATLCLGTVGNHILFI